MANSFSMLEIDGHVQDCPGTSKVWNYQGVHELFCQARCFYSRSTYLITVMHLFLISKVNIPLVNIERRSSVIRLRSQDPIARVMTKRASTPGEVNFVRRKGSRDRAHDSETRASVLGCGVEDVLVHDLHTTSADPALAGHCGCPRDAAEGVAGVVWPCLHYVVDYEKCSPPYCGHVSCPCACCWEDCVVGTAPVLLRVVC